MIAAAVSWHPELLGPLSTDMNLENLWDAIEVKTVDAHNRRLIDAELERRGRR